MVNRVKRSSPAKRLQRGASVLSAARAVDTRPVKERLERFERVQREYVGAQEKVDAAEAQLEAARARVAASSTAQEKAVEGLARALVADGQARANPFEQFGAPAPSAITKGTPTAVAKAVRQLVAKVEQDASAGKKTTEGARAAGKAAQAVDHAVAAEKAARGTLRAARATRDAVGEEWESALAALKRLASVLAEEGAPDVYVKLFPPVSRAAPKPKAAKEEEKPPTPTEPATVTQPATPTQDAA